jgi:AraC-like DNA-binding protein
VSVQEFRSDRVGEAGGADRAGGGDRWEYAAWSHGPAGVRGEGADGCGPAALVIDLGVARVCAAELAPLRTTRTLRLTRPGDPESYHVVVPVRGAVGVEPGRRRVEWRADSMYVSGSARPSATRFAAPAGAGPFRGVVAAVPKALLPLPADRLDSVAGRWLPAREGVAGLLTGFLIRLTEDPGAYRQADVPRLGAVTLELVTAVVAHLLDAEPAPAPETRRQTLMSRIRSFIQQHLHDAELTPGAIAAAHHISTSYLHQLFRAQETTVTGTIRRQRLEGARRDLAEPALRGTPIHRIAARWGFPEAAAFSRAFRAAYGMPPREYRHRALRGIASHDVV